MDKYIKFGIPILLSLGSFFYTFGEKIWKLIFPFKLNEKEKQMLLKYLEQKYPELENDLTNLLNLIKKEDINKLAEKIRELRQSKNTKVEKVLSEKKKIFILGDTGVGKSTLINCIEGKELAKEAQTSAPTTIEYKEFESDKYKNYIFCDTRGTEKNKYDEIVNDNLKSILENSKGLNSYLFWYLIGASSNLQSSDVNYIKNIVNLLNGKMPFFFIIARSVDEDNEKNRLESSLKEYFPYIINFNIFPLLARGTKRTPSFGLKELMEETEKFFKKDILQEIFKEIYKEDEFQEHLLNSLNNNSDIKTLFTLILNKMRLNDYSKELNDNENQQMDNFKNIYQTFVESHFNNIRELCCLIKAKNKIIDIDKLENTTERLIDLNNSDKCFEDNIDIKKEILKGFNEEEKGKIESKAKEYSSDEKTKSEAKNFLNYFSVIKFNLKLENHIKNNLLLIKGLLD